MTEKSKNAMSLPQKIKISPLARRYAQKHNIQPESITGSGPGKRIMAQDILDFIQKPTPSPEEIVSPDINANSPYCTLSQTIEISSILKIKSYLNNLSSTPQKLTLDDFILRAFIKAFIKLAPLEYPHNTLSDKLSINLYNKETELFHLLSDLNKLTVSQLSAYRHEAPVLDHTTTKPAPITYTHETEKTIEDIYTLLGTSQILLILPKIEICSTTKSLEITLNFDPKTLFTQKAQLLLKETKSLLESPSLLLL